MKLSRETRRKRRWTVSAPWLFFWLVLVVILGLVALTWRRSHQPVQTVATASYQTPAPVRALNTPG